VSEEPQTPDEPQASEFAFEAEPPVEQAPEPAVELEIPRGFQSLEPDWIRCEQMGSRIFMLIFGLGSALALLILGWLHIISRDTLVWWVAGWLVLIPGLAWLGYRWPVWEFPFRGWELREDSFDVRKGLIARRSIRVPRSRVQYTDVVQGPVQRRFGLATLQVHVAGTESATVALEGVRHELALRLRDILIEGGGDDAV